MGMYLEKQTLYDKDREMKSSPRDGNSQKDTRHDQDFPSLKFKRDEDGSGNSGDLKDLIPIVHAVNVLDDDRQEDFVGALENYWSARKGDEDKEKWLGEWLSKYES